MVSDWRKSIYWEEDGKLCVITFPPESSPWVAEVRLPLQLLAWLGEEIQASGTGAAALNEVGGLLYGSISEQTRERDGTAPLRRDVVLELFIPVPLSRPSSTFYHLSEEDKAGLRDQVASSADSTFSVVGMYRTHRRADLNVDGEDEKIISEFLKTPGSIFLVIRLEASGTPQAAFFIRGPESTSPEPVLTIPLDYAELGASAANLTFQPGSTECPVEPREGFIPLVETALRSAGHVRLRPVNDQPTVEPAYRYRRRMLAVAAGLALLTAAPVLTLRIQQRRHNIEAAAPASLSLRAAVEQDHLRINWNRNALPHPSTSGGLLLVSDGGSDTQIRLDSRMLETGTAQYFARSPVVRFELRVGSSSDAIVVARPDANMGDGYSMAQKRMAPPTSPTPRSNQGSPLKTSAVSLAGAKARAPKRFLPPARSSSSATALQVTLPQAASLSISPVSGEFPLTPPVSPMLPPPRTTALIATAPPANVVRTPQEQAIDYIAPQVKKRVLPEVSPSLDLLGASKVTIRVRVIIDEQGNVTQAESLTRGEPVVEHLSRLALNAARGWRFEPARKANQNVESEAVLAFDFERDNETKR